jgi:diguanylate cyclase (GGDEF)-like protein
MFPRPAHTDPEPLADATASRLTLRFADPAIEQAYRRDHYERTVGHMRLALLLGGSLYALFGILDAQLIPEAEAAAWLIRYGVGCPVIFGMLLFSYARRFRDYMEISMAVVGLVAGCGIILMLALASPPGNYLYYGGLLLVTTFCFTLLQLPFVTATAVAWLLFALYQAVAIAISHTPTAILLNNTFFLVSFNVAGMLVSYSLERYMRTGFLQRRIISRQTEQLREHLNEVERRRREAEDISRLDPLTNLYNRRHFFAIVDDESARNRQYLRDLSLMILDLDHFKAINDTYGHSVGDRVLQSVARIIEGSIRDRDIPCRYGGEEFAVLLPQAGIQAAQGIGQRLREAIEGAAIQTDRGTVRLTVSIGVACLAATDEADFDTLIDRADAALYEAKGAGRNQLRVALG